MFEIASELEKKNLPFALVTIIRTNNIVPRKSSRMIVLPNGESYGTVGGGDAERIAKKKALEALEKKENVSFKIMLPKGEVEMICDVDKRARKLYIVGYGHVGKAIGELL